MKLLKKEFGKYNNQNVIEYTLDNGSNLNIKILSYGGIIRELNFKDKNRVLGLNNIEEYINETNYFGAIIGRVAGRISKGQIEIDNKIFKLDQNEGSTCLHGGSKGFSNQLWTLVDEEIADDFVSITLKYISPDMECGFPGELIVYTKYIVNKDDTLSIEYSAKTSKKTHISLTNHSYFNLNDDLNEDILEHVLKIDADSYIRLDEKNIPVEITKVEDTPFDFRIGKKIKEDMDLSHEDLKETEGYDHPFILNNSTIDQIELYSEKSGVELTIETTEPVVVLYCSNKLETHKYQGVCLETQRYTNPRNILKPNEQYYSKTSYKFH